MSTNPTLDSYMYHAQGKKMRNAEVASPILFQAVCADQINQLILLVDMQFLGMHP